MKFVKRMTALFLAFTLCMGLIQIQSTDVYAASGKIKVTNIKNKKVVMYLGTVKQLKVNQPMKKMKFTSSKKSVVKVSNTGLLSAIKVGKATITLKNKSTGKKCRIKITVRKPVGYSINKVSGSYNGVQNVKIKAKKGYKVYYSLNGKLSSKKVIKSKKTKVIKISKTKNLYVYAVKKSKKVSLRKINKNIEKYVVMYRYNIKKSEDAPRNQQNTEKETETTTEKTIESNCEQPTVKVESDEEVDSDNDGLPDYIEEYFGCDTEKEDTDGDGLSDYIELKIIGTDPTVVDSDGNGIHDPEEDFDRDGLSNLFEIKNGTQPDEKDSDGDDVDDYDEIYTYFTNPNNEDTDGDGASDGWEIENGYDPLIKNNKFSVKKTYETKEDVNTVPSVIIDSVNGKQVESLRITKCEETFGIDENTPGYLGECYEFTMDGELTSAQISFSFKEELWNDNFYPAIYYYNESKGFLEKLDNQAVVGNTVFAETTHFSKYLLLNELDFDQVWSWNIRSDFSFMKNLDIAFVIDSSGSMQTTDPGDLRKALTGDCIRKLKEEDKACVIHFDREAEIDVSFTNDTADLLYAVSQIDSEGGTAIFNGIAAGIRQFEALNDSWLTEKIMFVLTDGYDDIGTQETNTAIYDELIAQARANGIKIYTVGLGDVNVDLLTKIATQTQGRYYQADTYTDLYAAFDIINEEIDYTTDTNKDGISDYYTKLMCDGTLRSGTGRKVFGDATYEEVQDNNDYDGDGKTNGDEIIISREVDVVYAREITSPINPDSDFDGQNDNVDQSPRSNNFSVSLQTNNSEIVNSEMEYQMNYRVFFNSPTQYSSALSTVSCILSSGAYHTTVIEIQKDEEKSENESESESENEGESESKDKNQDDDSMKQYMRYLGLDNIANYHLANGGKSDTNTLEDAMVLYSDNDISEVYMGTREVICDRQTKNIVCIVVRGTDGTFKEWQSNFDIGSVKNGSSTYGWNNTENHRGFDVATNRILRFVDTYVDTVLDDKDNICYWIMGHSRGAGIANLLSAYLIDEGCDVWGYTFAAPATTTSAQVDEVKYNSIFNIVNADDFVPCLPLAAWGFELYGRTATQSIDDLYEEEWEDLTGCTIKLSKYIDTGIVDYNNDKLGMSDTIDALSEIAIDRDECYELIRIPNRATTFAFSSYMKAEAGLQKEIGTYPECTEGTYEAEIKPESLVYVIYIYQKPAFLMELLVAIMANKETKMDELTFVTIDVADYLESAKWGIIRSNLGGIKHPHYTESYYVLSKHMEEGDFR